MLCTWFDVRLLVNCFGMIWFVTLGSNVLSTVIAVCNVVHVGLLRCMGAQITFSRELCVGVRMVGCILMRSIVCLGLSMFDGYLHVYRLYFWLLCGCYADSLGRFFHGCLMWAFDLRSLLVQLKLIVSCVVVWAIFAYEMVLNFIDKLEWFAGMLLDFALFVMIVVCDANLHRVFVPVSWVLCLNVIYCQYDCCRCMPVVMLVIYETVNLVFMSLWSYLCMGMRFAMELCMTVFVIVDLFMQFFRCYYVDNDLCCSLFILVLMCVDNCVSGSVCCDVHGFEVQVKFGFVLAAAFVVIVFAVGCSAVRFLCIGQCIIVSLAGECYNVVGLSIITFELSYVFDMDILVRRLPDVMVLVGCGIMFVIVNCYYIACCLVLALWWIDDCWDLQVLWLDSREMVCCVFMRIVQCYLSCDHCIVFCVYGITNDIIGVYLVYTIVDCFGCYASITSLRLIAFIVGYLVSRFGCDFLLKLDGVLVTHRFAGVVAAFAYLCLGDVMQLYGLLVIRVVASRVVGFGGGAVLVVMHGDMCTFCVMLVYLTMLLDFDDLVYGIYGHTVNDAFSAMVVFSECNSLSLLFVVVGITRIADKITHARFLYLCRRPRVCCFIYVCNVVGVSLLPRWFSLLELLCGRVVMFRALRLIWYVAFNLHVFVGLNCLACFVVFVSGDYTMFKITLPVVFLLGVMGYKGIYLFGERGRGRFRGATDGLLRLFTPIYGVQPAMGCLVVVMVVNMSGNFVIVHFVGFYLRFQNVAILDGLASGIWLDSLFNIIFVVWIRFEPILVYVVVIGCVGGGLCVFTRLLMHAFNCCVIIGCLVLANFAGGDCMLAPRRSRLQLVNHSVVLSCCVTFAWVALVCYRLQGCCFRYVFYLLLVCIEVLDGTFGFVVCCLRLAVLFLCFAVNLGCCWIVECVYLPLRRDTYVGCLGCILIVTKIIVNCFIVFNGCFGSLTFTMLSLLALIELQALSALLMLFGLVSGVRTAFSAVGVQRCLHLLYAYLQMCYILELLVLLYCEVVGYCADGLLSLCTFQLWFVMPPGYNLGKLVIMSRFYLLLLIACCTNSVPFCHLLYNDCLHCALLDLCVKALRLLERLLTMVRCTTVFGPYNSYGYGHVAVLCVTSFRLIALIGSIALKFDCLFRGHAVSFIYLFVVV
eukprot:gene2983-1965_t